MTKNETLTLINAAFLTFSMLAFLIVGAVFASPDATTTEIVYILMTGVSSFISLIIFLYQIGMGLVIKDFITDVKSIYFNKEDN